MRAVFKSNSQQPVADASRTNNSSNFDAQSLLRLWVHRCLGCTSIVTVDRDMFPLLDIDRSYSAEKAYSIAKKLARKFGTVLSQDPDNLTFTMMSGDMALAAMRCGPTEFKKEIYKLVDKINDTRHSGNLKHTT